MTRESVNHFIEIRSIILKPGTREEFHWLYIEQALPRSNAGTSMWWRIVRHCMMRIRIT
jgi:hypothetical protein